MATAFVLVVLLQLNPTLVVGPELAPLATAVALSYGFHFTAVWYVLLVFQQVFASRPVSPGWVSLRLLTVMGAATSAAGALLMWLNARGFALAIDGDTVRRIAVGAAVSTACAVVFVLLAFAHARLGARRRGIVAVLFLVTLGASIGGPVTLRGRGDVALLPARRITVAARATPPGPARVTLLIVDGASLDVIRTVVAGGRLPNFGRMLEGGAALHLATLRPTQPEPVWTAVATGKWSAKNGIRSAATYRPRGGGPAIDLLPDHCFAYVLVRFGFLDEARHLSSSVRARPLWDILDAHGLTVGLIGWPVTYPATAVNGYVVSDAFLRTRDPAVELQEQPSVYPPDVADQVRLALGEVPPVAPDAMLAASTLLSPGDDRESRAAAIDADRVHRHLGEQLQRSLPTSFTAVRLQAVDAIGHYYLRYAVPNAFGDVTDEERRQFGRVLEQAYASVDAAVGRALASLGPDDLLLVVSGFGMEPLSPGKRLVERVFGNAALSGTHERAPDGFLIAYGGSVQRGARVLRGSIVDVTPTVLYYLGLPVGRDMDGYARADLFQRRFTEARPIAFIPSYDR